MKFFNCAFFKELTHLINYKNKYLELFPLVNKKVYVPVSVSRGFEHRCCLLNMFITTYLKFPLCRIVEMGYFARADGGGKESTDEETLEVKCRQMKRCLKKVSTYRKSRQMKR